MNDQKLPRISIEQEDFLEGPSQTPLLVFNCGNRVPSVENKKYQLEDLPDEVLLNTLNFLELPDLIRCGLVSKRIRSVSFIESLWQKIDISNRGHSRKKVPSDLVKRIINRGCKSLRLRGCRITGNIKRSNFNLELNYWYDLQKKDKIINQIKPEKRRKILFSSDSDSYPDSDSECESMWTAKRTRTETKVDTCQLISLDLTNCKVKSSVMNVLLTVCHSLKNLSLRNAVLTPFLFEIICSQNGQTLQTLKLTFSYGTSCDIFPSEMMLIVTKCVRLREVDFSGCRLSKNSVEILVNNISQNVEKLGLDGPGIQPEDKHIVALVSRCKKITSLNLAFGRELTGISITSIILNLKLTLEELDIGYCQLITHTKLLEMRVMPKLKTVYYGTGMLSDFYELKKKLPQLTRNNDWKQKFDLLMS